MTKNREKNASYKAHRRAILGLAILSIMIFTINLPTITSAYTWNTSYEENVSAYYSFEESSGDLIDMINGNNNGSNFGASYQATGINNYAWDFEESQSDHVNISAHSELNNADLVVNAWINPESLPANAVIISKGNFNDNDANSLDMVVQSDGDLHCKTYDSGGVFDCTVSANSRVYIGGWQMITCAVDYSAQKTYVYYNGTKINEASCTNPIYMNTSHSWTIGRTQYPSAAQFFDGLIDELSIYNLWKSDNFISQLFDSGTGTFYTSGAGGSVTYSQTDTPDPAMLGDNATFTLNITFPNTITNFSAELIWNNTNYGYNYSENYSEEAFVNATFEIPVTAGTISWYWNYSSNGTTFATTTPQNQTIIEGELFFCNASGIPYINLSFEDEVTSASINATIDSMDITYWTSDQNINSSLSYTNNTANDEYTFCYTPSDDNINLVADIEYSSDGYPQRDYTLPSILLTNTTTNRTLYLLSSSDGIYVTFQLINQAEQPLESVFTNLTGSVLGLIGSGYTGADGGITYWQNPDTTHTACFLLSPYPLYCITQQFTQTSYTINLGTTASAPNDYNQGISYSVRPIATYLSNGTEYNFNFTIASSYWSLDSFGMNITNSSGYFFGAHSSTSGSGGIVNLDQNTGNETSLILSYYWVVNGTTTWASRNYLILDISDSAYSIANLFTRLRTYVNSSQGFFGLGDFGLGLLSFMIILLITGYTKKRYGVSNITTLLGLVFALVVLLDVSLGLVPNPINAVDNFLSIVVGLIFVGFLFKELF